MTPEYGAAITIGEDRYARLCRCYCDLNKFDKRGALDAIQGCEKTVPAEP